MNLDNIFGRKKSYTEKTEDEIIHDLETERYPFENQFNTFFEFSKQLPAESDVVNGKTREYISTAQLVPSYLNVFGNAALVPSTVFHRVRQLNPDDYPDDLLIDTESKVGEGKYFVNRLNKQLMKDIFLPDMGSEIRSLAHETANNHDFLELRNNFGNNSDSEKLFKKLKVEPEDEENHTEDEYLRE